MKNININNNIDNNDKIKTFIKLEFSELKKKDLYELDESKKFITLYNLETKNQLTEKKIYPFEFDKIFLNNDSYSYIYEEICLNCIKQFIEGVSFSFISFGETNSNKFNLLFGNVVQDYTNINNHGIFIRYLSDLINKNKIYNYNIKLSSILIYEDKLVDLFDIIDINKKKKINNISDLLKNSIKIGKDPKIINTISKNEINNNDEIDKIIINLHEMINILLNLDNKGNNYIYSLSNICFIIYLLDKNEITLSTSTFLLLNGCEHTYDTNNQKYDKEVKNSIAKTVANTINIQLTYDSILNCIKNNKYITNSINPMNNKTKNLERKLSRKTIYKENNNEKISQTNESSFNKVINKNSKLIIALYDICFSNNINKIKYRIIGNIKPMTEYFKITRDTLLFCSKCYKIMNNPNAEITSSEETKKNNDIEELNFQIKLHKKQIDTLNRTLEKKNSHIDYLSKHYNAQINAIKKYFDFKGDPNTLISEDINYEENNYIKNMKYKIKIQEKEIEEYKLKIEKLEHEFNRYKNISSIKTNDEAMINYYLSIKNDNTVKDFVNKLNKEIIELNEIIKKKDKIIEELKKDLDKKGNILCNIHKINKNKKENKKLKENQTNEIIIKLKNEIKTMKINEQKNIQDLNENYNSIINENKDTIHNIQQRLNGIEEIYKKQLRILNKELVELCEIILNLLNGYENLFDGENSKEGKLNMKKKEDFDKVIANINEEINCYNFSYLYQELKNQNKTKESIIESLTKENIKNIKKTINNEIDSTKRMVKEDKLIISAKEMAISELNNKLLSMSNYLKEQVKQNNKNNIIINSQKLTIERMQKSAFIYENLLKNKMKDKIISNLKYHSPNFSRKKFIRKNIINNLNLSNNIYNNKKIMDDLSIINDPSSIKMEKYEVSFKSERKDDIFKNKSKEKKEIFFIKKSKRPFSSDNHKNNN